MTKLADGSVGPQDIIWGAHKEGQVRPEEACCKVNHKWGPSLGALISVITLELLNICCDVVMKEVNKLREVAIRGGRE